MKLASIHTISAAVAVCPVLVTAASGGITTLEIPMPEGSLGVFGLQYLQDFAQAAPAEPMQVVGLRLEVNFSTAGPLPFADAADIEFQLQLPTVSLPFWNVSGADLGWSGQGEFTGEASTTAFNEPLIFEPGAALLLWLRRIVNLNDAMPQLGGQLTDSRWEVDLAPIPAPAGAAAFGIAAAACARRRRRR